MTFRIPRPALLLPIMALGACSSQGELVTDQGVGVQSLRTVCPAVGVPDYTGDVTLFRTPGARTADQIDVAATITGLRSTCNDGAEQVYSLADFDVVAQRRDTAGARTVDLPYFSTVMQGGSAVVAKRVGTVRIAFADGQARGQGHAQASAYVDRAAATLPDDIRRQITRRRRAGDEDAAVDPLTLPDVRAAVAQATFEHLVGFQLTQDQLAYNATR